MKCIINDRQGDISTVIFPSFSAQQFVVFLLFLVICNWYCYWITKRIRSPLSLMLIYIFLISRGLLNFDISYIVCVFRLFVLFIAFWLVDVDYCLLLWISDFRSIFSRVSNWREFCLLTDVFFLKKNSCSFLLWGNQYKWIITILQVQSCRWDEIITWWNSYMISDALAPAHVLFKSRWNFYMKFLYGLGTLILKFSCNFPPWLHCSTDCYI